jgi:hypothetical protein
MVLLVAAIDHDKEPKEKWIDFLLHTPFQYLLPGAFSQVILRSGT